MKQRFQGHPWQHVSWEFNLDSLNPEPGFSLRCQQPQEEGVALTLALMLRGFFFSAPSALCMPTRVYARVYVFTKAAAVSSGVSQTVPVSAGYPCTLAFAHPIPLPCSLGWVSGAPLQGEASDSTQGHFSSPSHSTFIPGANPRLLWFPLQGFNQPFLGDPDLHHTKGFNAHTSLGSQSML